MGIYNKLSNDERQNILDLYASGMTIKNIATATNRATGSVGNVIKGVTNRAKPVPPERLQQISDAYLNNKDTLACASQFGISRGYIYQLLDKNNIDRQKPSEYTRKYYLNENYFEQLTQESAYWLGFLLADGCLYQDKYSKRIQLCLAQKDEAHLEMFRNAITDTPLYHGHSKLSGKDRYHVRLTISSEKVYSSLIKLGLFPRKSLVHDTPIIPEHLMAPMYLGYFDGDGSVYAAQSQTQRGKKYGINIVGPQSFCLKFQSWMFDKTQAHLNIAQLNCADGKLYSLRGATEASIRILTFLYEKSDIFLSRKFNIYKQMIYDHSSERSRVRPKLPESVWNAAIQLCRQI